MKHSGMVVAVLCLALWGLSHTGWAQSFGFGVGGFLDNRMPFAVAAARVGDFGFETGLGVARVDFVEDGLLFFASAVSATSVFKLYVPVGWPQVTPFLGAGASLMNLGIESAGETLPTVSTTISGVQGTAGLEASVPQFSMSVYVSGNISTLDDSVRIQAGGRTVTLRHLIKSHGPSATVGFRYEFVSYRGFARS